MADDEYVGDGCPRCWGAGEVFGLHSMLPCNCRFGDALRAEADRRKADDQPAEPLVICENRRCRRIQGERCPTCDGGLEMSPDGLLVFCVENTFHCFKPRSRVEI